MFRTYIIILLFISLIAICADGRENKSKKIHQNAGQNVKVKKSTGNIDDLLKQIDSAKKQLKYQEFRLQNIQDKIIERRLRNTP
jgi:hypothetical protein